MNHGGQKSLMSTSIKKVCCLVFVSLTLLSVRSQVYSDKVVGKKNLSLSDSIKGSEYPYLLPIWGKKVTKLGFDLPYSAGFSAQYVWQRSELVINNLAIGFNNGPKHDLDELIRFDNAIAEGSVLNVRPDIWILPFLNIYGIFAKSNTSTDVNFGIWLPMDAAQPDGDWQEIAHFQTKAKFNGNTTAGFGITPTIGIGGGWMALDLNFSWTDVAALEKPAFVFNFGPRFGKSFRFNKKPQMNVAAWVGGFRAKYSNATTGSLPLSDLFPGDKLEAKIAQGQARVNEAEQNLNNWWNGLTNAQQNLPSNKVKYDVGTRTITRASEFLESASAAMGTPNGTVQYSLDKRLKDMWNFIVGGQFQINKHWMLRGEYGFLGSRRQFIGGLQYRFGL
jgi:hypothetical protein